jgi:L-alanine-DL-glutamate epimerase-like enolase superfamily enzyme
MADGPDEPCWGGWSETTRVQARARARSTAADRLAWVEEMLEIAHHSGALARLRRAKHEAILRAFGVETKTDEPGP